MKAINPMQVPGAAATPKIYTNSRSAQGKQPDDTAKSPSDQHKDTIKLPRTAEQPVVPANTYRFITNHI